MCECVDDGVVENFAGMNKPENRRKLALWAATLAGGDVAAIEQYIAEHPYEDTCAAEVLLDDVRHAA